MRQYLAVKSVKIVIFDVRHLTTKRLVETSSIVHDELIWLPDKFKMSLLARMDKLKLKKNIKRIIKIPPPHTHTHTHTLITDFECLLYGKCMFGKFILI